MSSPIISKHTHQILIPYTAPIRALWSDPPLLKHNGSTFAVLPHTPRTQVQLRAAGIECPAPILFHYNWKSADGEKPFEVQRQTGALASSNQRAYILNDMGTGKTRASLWAWKYLYDAGVAKKLLVVAPLSTLKFVWLREIGNVMPEIKAVVLHGSRDFRREQLASDADVFIINHDGLKTILAELHGRLDIDCLILDELAVYRNNSQRSKIMREFSRRFVWVWGMTGRPMPNAPTDVWAQCKIITPGTCPKFFRHARTQLMHQVSQFKWVPKDGAIETALQWMQPSVRYSLDDVIELPEAIFRRMDVEMSDEQATVYRRLANEFAVMVQQQRITAANAGVALGKLLQVGCGYVYSSNPLYVTLDSKPRQDALLDLLDEASHKVIVFAPWRHLITNLSVLFNKESIDHAMVHGGTKHREQLFNAFQSTDQYRVLLAHPACIHHGVTLTAATAIVWYSPVTSLEIYEQANARIRRVGQKEKQLFLHLQSSSHERKVYGMLRNKQRVQDLFLQLIKTAINGDQDVEDTGSEGSRQIA